MRWRDWLVLCLKNSGSPSHGRVLVRGKLKPMSAVLTPNPEALAPNVAPARLGRVVSGLDGNAGWAMAWTLKRNCALAPSQVLQSYGFVCAVSLLVAGGFWWQGVTMVLPFALLELVALAVALMVYARHAGDRDHIVLSRQSLVVERRCGAQVERIEFLPDWVRVAPLADDQSLIELSGQGRRIVVGRLVRPELRRQLARELRQALHQSRWPDATLVAARV